MHQHEQAEHCFVGLVCTTARCVREDGVVIMIDLEEIDLSAAPCTNARKIRAGKCEDTCTRTKYAQLEAVTGISTW